MKRRADGGEIEPVPLIRDAQHLRELLSNAEGDEDLNAIKAQGEKQGLYTKGWADPGKTVKNRGGKVDGKRPKMRLDRKKAGKR